MKIITNKKTLSLISSFIFLNLIFPLVSSAVPIKYEPLEKDAFGNLAATSTSSDLSNFLTQAFEFFLATAAALAVIMIVWGGVEIMLSESVLAKGEGKKRIQNAIYGLLLALFSWLILYIINPDILNFKL